VANLKNYFLFEARHQNKRSTQQAATVSPHRSTVRACVRARERALVLNCCVNSLWPSTPEYRGWRSRR
jgi:hypothetical protein